MKLRPWPDNLESTILSIVRECDESPISLSEVIRGVKQEIPSARDAQVVMAVHDLIDFRRLSLSADRRLYIVDNVS